MRWEYLWGKSWDLVVEPKIYQTLYGKSSKRFMIIVPDFYHHSLSKSLDLSQRHYKLLKQICQKNIVVDSWWDGEH